MKIQGILTEMKDLGNPMGQNGTRYAFGKLRIADGREIDLMFVNRAFKQLANRPVTITDLSEKGEKIRWETDKSRYRIYGTGVSIVCEGQEYADIPAEVPTHSGPPPGATGAPPGATGVPAARPQARRGGSESMADLIDYGLSAVGYARFCGETDPAILAAIFNSSMYGIKEGREMPSKETWQARNVFSATSVTPADQPPGGAADEPDASWGDDEPSPF